MTASRTDRIAGCLLAGAAGDALGAPVEFLSLLAIRARWGPGGIRDIEGGITDDTQMTLFTADGLLRAGDADPRPFLHSAYLRWLETQGAEVAGSGVGPAARGSDGWLFGVAGLHRRRGPGNTCLSALRTGVMGTRDRPLNDSKGCGGVMRAAPAGLVGHPDPFALGCDLAAITHSHPSGWLAAGALALMADRLLAGAEPGDAARDALRRLATEPHHDEVSGALRRALDAGGAAAADAARGEPPAIGVVERLGAGWVAEEALAMAVFCAVAHPDDLEPALVLAANHSGDSDSTAAIAGNLMGARLGRAAIPARWLDALELRAEIEAIAADLATGPDGGPAWRARYPPD